MFHSENTRHINGNMPLKNFFWLTLWRGWHDQQFQICVYVSQCSCRAHREQCAHLCMTVLNARSSRLNALSILSPLGPATHIISTVSLQILRDTWLLTVLCMLLIIQKYSSYMAIYILSLNSGMKFTVTFKVLHTARIRIIHSLL